MQSKRNSGDGSRLPTLGELISARRKDLGWTYDHLSEESNGALSKQRWQQLGTDTRVNEFPEPRTLQLIADTIGVGVDRVILSTAVTLGVDIPDDRSRFATMLPTSADDLTDDQRDAVYAVIRAMQPRDRDTRPRRLLDGAVQLSRVTPDSLVTETLLPADDAGEAADDLPYAARTAPPGYVSPGRAARDVQDEAGGESQDQGEEK